MSIDYATIGRIGAHVLHARQDPRETTRNARAASTTKLNEKLLAEIDERDPDLPEAERLRRLQHARKAHFARLAFASAQARRRARFGGAGK